MVRSYRSVVAVAWRVCYRAGCGKTMMEHHLGQPGACAEFKATMDPRPAFLCFNDWAGKSKVWVEVVGETPKRWRIQLLPPSTETIPLAGKGRYLVYGATVLVPKTAVEFPQ